MRTRTFLLIIVLSITAVATEAQEIVDIEKLVESGKFLFTADRAFPSGGRTVDLMNRANKVEFNGDDARGDLAFFGNATNASAAYSSDGGGIKFDGEMTNKQIKVKKKKVILSFKIKAPGEQYICSLSISPSGSATLAISSNNKSSISYNGAVKAIEEK